MEESRVHTGGRMWENMIVKLTNRMSSVDHRARRFTDQLDEFEKL